MTDNFKKDIERIQQIAIIPTLLDVVCKTTGMGFSAVARVTEGRWIACAVKDDISFGLKPGGELEVKTTICDEIRASGKGVIIDHVTDDPAFCEHHTPKMYGFQSYISIPIFLKSGDFFGTLCAIDPRPAVLKNTEKVAMFELFAELIAFHLQAIDNMELAKTNLFETSRQMEIFREENRQYQHISTHTLQEPLRKIRLYSDMLVDKLSSEEQGDTKKIAAKVHSLVEDLATVVSELNEFSVLTDESQPFEAADLNTIIAAALKKLQPEIEEKNALIDISELPDVYGVPIQLTMLFWHLFGNALKFTRENVQPAIKVYASTLTADDAAAEKTLHPGYQYCNISVEDNGVGINHTQLDKIFDLLTWTDGGVGVKRFGTSLAQCKKIVLNHYGGLKVTSTQGEGSTFQVLLPVGKV